ncbi:MAG: Na/Pi symporter [Firmicutes bacterium]|nr:Na/Pi symporter [Bacillota bacterium]
MSSVLIAGTRIAGGLALFILGLFTLRAGLREQSGPKAERWIARLVRTPIRGLFTGIGATLVTQSSAAVTVLSMGLVASGLLTFENTIGIILGTNIGSTWTVGLLTLNLERFGPYVVAIAVAGFLILALQRHRIPRQWPLLRSLCISLAGFGTLFVGFGILSDAAGGLLASHTLRAWLLVASHQPLLGVAAGTVVTALIGSSSASTALTLSLAQAGALSLPGAISIVLGNNIGTCVTAVLASIGGTRPVQRVAATHVLLNVAGALVFLPFIHPFAAFITRLAHTPGTQVALAHILFNVICSLAALPFAGAIARGIVRLLPESN